MKEIKIGCGWWGFREKPIEEQLAISNRFGFRTMEFGIGNDLISTVPLNSTDQEIGNLMNQADVLAIGLPFATLENDFTRASSEEHAAMLDHVLKVIRLAGRFGISHIRIFAGFTRAEDITFRLYNQVIDAFNRCEEACKPLGIQISIETHGRITQKGDVAFHENTISTDPHFLEKLMKDLPRGVGFNYDPGNVKAVRPDDRDFCLDIINERINYCHLKDWKKKEGGWVSCAIGDDDLDYAKLLPRINFDGIYLIEYEPLHDLEQGIARSLGYLENIGYTLNYC